MDECSAFRGISQSTTFVGFTPGLGFLLILLDLLILVPGLPPLAVFARVADGAGGGGLLLLDAAEGDSGAPGSGIVANVGSPSYVGVVLLGRADGFNPSGSSSDPSRHVRCFPPLTISFSSDSLPFALLDVPTYPSIWSDRKAEAGSTFSFASVDVDLCFRVVRRGEERDWIGWGEKRRLRARSETSGRRRYGNAGWGVALRPSSEQKTRNHHETSASMRSIAYKL